MQATARAETRRTHLASAGLFHFVCLFRRKLRGYPWWKVGIFYVLRKANRLAATKLKLPTVLGYDEKGAYWFEYQGGFESLESAHRAIAHMQAEFKDMGIDDVQFELTENLPLNGLLPKQTGRYLDQDYVGDFIPEFYKERAGPVMCPFKRTLCTPEEVISRSEIQPLFDQVKEVDHALNR